MQNHAAAVLLFSALVGAQSFADDDPEPKARNARPREIAVKGLPTDLGKFDQPARIKSEKELASLVPDKGARAAILKAVDFRREHLVLFSWNGSRRDRVNPAAAGRGVAGFDLVEGFTDDMFSQAKLFAVPSGAKVRVQVTAEERPRKKK